MVFGHTEEIDKGIKGEYRIDSYVKQGRSSTSFYWLAYFELYTINIGYKYPCFNVISFYLHTNYMVSKISTYNLQFSQPVVSHVQVLQPFLKVAPTAYVVPSSSKHPNGAVKTTASQVSQRHAKISTSFILSVEVKDCVRYAAKHLHPVTKALFNHRTSGFSIAYLRYEF